MAFWPINRFPYTSYTEINLDWIMRKLKEVAPVGADNPVSYDPQTPTPEEQEQARQNLGISYPTAPVDSVNGQTGDVVLTYSDVGALPDTYTPPAAPVDSVNGQTGDVVVPTIPSGGTTGQVLAKATGTDYDVEWTSTVTGVSSVNGLTGAVTLSFAQVGALGIYRAANATDGAGTSYDLTVSTYRDFLVIVCSTTGANHNTIYYVDSHNDRIRLLGNTASGLSPSITDGVLTIVSSGANSKVYIAPLPSIS